MADELDLISLSALQHYLYCPRQCALIHIDGLWSENRFTAEGTILHNRVDQPGQHSRSTGQDGDSRIRVVRSLPLLNTRLGLIGRADCVEVPTDETGHMNAPPRPIEHKRGSPKRLNADRVQLCAQALCLEEMFATAVPEGALFYNAIRRRERVMFDGCLRSRTLATIAAVRDLIRSNRTPAAEHGKKCRHCSLVNLCLPRGTGASRSPQLYLRRSLEASLSASEGVLP